MIICPTCHSKAVELERVLSVEASANHLIPERRSLERNVKLREALRHLWDGDEVTIKRCHDCGFGFSDPFVAGNEDVYNTIGGGAQHYPQDRFEFSVTIDALHARGAWIGCLRSGPGRGLSYGN